MNSRFPRNIEQIIFFIREATPLIPTFLIERESFLIKRGFQPTQQECSFLSKIPDDVLEMLIRGSSNNLLWSHTPLNVCIFLTIAAFRNSYLSEFFNDKENFFLTTPIQFSFEEQMFLKSQNFGQLQFVVSQISMNEPTIGRVVSIFNESDLLIYFYISKLPPQPIESVNSNEVLALLGIRPR